MTCSPARLDANRRNAARSTGPRTAEGKERSRANALRHGMAAEVVAPEGEAAEVDRRAEALEAEIKTAGELGRILVRRVAVLSARLDRCARHEAAMIARRVRDAGVAHDDDRLASVAALGDRIADAPALHVRRLGRTPEGIAWLIGAWLALKADLSRPGRAAWNEDHLRRAAHLTGRTLGEGAPSPINALFRAAWGDFSGLAPDQGAGLSPPERNAWAREQVGRRIDAEVEALGALRAEIDVGRLERDRAEAAERALFDPSREATLARRYEAAAERELHRSLRALGGHATTGAGTEVGEADHAPPVPVGSFGIVPSPATPIAPTPETPADSPSERGSGRAVPIAAMGSIREAGEGGETRSRFGSPPAWPAGPGSPRMGITPGRIAAMSTERRRILVVDDSADTVAMMRVLLRRDGHEVRVAHDGPAALEVAADYGPEVVLLDLTLPGLTGEEVAAELRRREATASALIVAVSGYNDGVPPGFDHLLAKPVDHDALRKLLATSGPEPA